MIRITTLGVGVTYPSCESPFEYPLWSNLRVATRPTEVQDSEAHRQRIRMADPIRSHSLTQTLPWNLVLDSAVPTELLNLCVDKNVRNFTHMRYSAATSDLNNFKHNDSTLHQVYCGPPC